MAGEVVVCSECGHSSDVHGIEGCEASVRSFRGTFRGTGACPCPLHEEDILPMTPEQLAEFDRNRTAAVSKANLGADVSAVAERLDQAATRHTIKVNVTNVPAVKEQMAALTARSELLDRIHDEAFPNDPYMLGRLHAEMERLGYGKGE